MPASPFISICIPAYKRMEYLQRLLDSIAIQSWKNFEVILTDDSPDESVHSVYMRYKEIFPLYYYHNSPSLGTPENWNEAIRKAKGKWIKLMHDDDWFAEKDSLAKFAETVQNYPTSFFFFSAYRNTHLKTDQTKDIFISPFRHRALRHNPVSLISDNVIGPPSCVLFSANQFISFDNQLKWLVDIDFYIRYLSQTDAVYIHEILICIGLSESQVTKETFRNPRIEIPENLTLLMKVGSQQLDNMLVFDAWWRLVRNLRIRDSGQIYSSGYKGQIPSRILSIIRFQRKISLRLLRVGLLSKFFMIVCYIFTSNKKPG
jgi:glycosyltransferase involved in cell wall biosynthesis